MARCRCLPGRSTPSTSTGGSRGGATAISVTVGGANLGPDTTAKVIAWVAEQIETRPELMLCRTGNDIRTAKREGKLGMFYHFQGPSPLGIDLDLIWFYKQAGVGVMQVAYNTRNPYANGATERVDAGLSTLGIGLVKACNSARMIVDVSHTSARSQLDAIEASSEPVIISHGNAYGKIDNPRNVSEEVLKAIAASGGSAGAVGYPAFVSKNKRPSMDDMVEMIDYMVELMGIDHVTCGIDYDPTTKGVVPAEKVEVQYNALVASGAWDPSAYPAPPYYYPEGPVPAFHELSATTRERVIRHGGKSTTDATELPAKIAATRDAIARLDGVTLDWISTWVNALIAPLRDAGLTVSGRRAVMLARNARSLLAAVEVLELKCDAAEALFRALRAGLPQRAEGRAKPSFAP